MGVKRLFLCSREQFFIWSSGGNADDIFKSLTEGDRLIIYDLGGALNPRMRAETTKLEESHCAEIVDAKKLADNLVLDNIKGQIGKYGSAETDVYFICSQMADYCDKLPPAPTNQYRTLVLQDKIRVNKSGRNRKGKEKKDSNGSVSRKGNHEVSQPADAEDRQSRNKNGSAGRQPTQKQQKGPSSDQEKLRQSPDINRKEETETISSSSVQPENLSAEEQSGENTDKLKNEEENAQDLRTGEKKSGATAKAEKRREEEVDLGGTDFDPLDAISGNPMKPAGLKTAENTQTAANSGTAEAGAGSQKSGKGRNDRSWKKKQAEQDDDISQRDLIKIIFGEQKESKELEELFSEGDNYRAGVIKTLEDRFIIHLNNLLPAFAARKEPVDIYKQILSVFISCETKDIFESDWNLEEPNKKLDGLTEETFQSLREEALYYAKQCDMFYSEDKWNH